MVTLSVADPTICAVNESVMLKQGLLSPQVVVLIFKGIGETLVTAGVQGPANSNYADIDPSFVQVRSLASFRLSTQNMILQPNGFTILTISPATEIAKDVIVSLSLTSSILRIFPSSFVLSPPRILVGLNVTPFVGMKVVKSEQYQVWPRFGIGEIVRILNDNMNIVDVNWTMGVSMQTNYVGFNGEYMLASYQPTIQNVNLTYIDSGSSSLSISSLSADLNYHGVQYQNAVTVLCPPRFITSESILFVQYLQTGTVNILPALALTEDVLLKITVNNSVANNLGINQNLINLSETQLHFSQAFSNSIQNLKTVNISCNSDGSSDLVFQADGGDFSQIDYIGLQVVCLPGFSLSNSKPLRLSILSPTISISVTPLSILTQESTVVIASNDSALIKFTKRLVFMPFVYSQQKNIVIEFGGQLRSGSVSLSLQAYGGNYEGVAVFDAVQVWVYGPSLNTPSNIIQVHPESSSDFFVSLDTPPSAPVYILAVSADESIVTVSGQQYPATDTSDQQFQVTHVSAGNTTLSLTVSSTLGSTYGMLQQLVKQVKVQALSTGFIFSTSMISIAPYSNVSISFGPDSTPDSEVIVYISAEPTGIVSLSPSIFYFSQGVAGQGSTILISWASPGAATLLIKSEGGLYQYITSDIPMTVISLPYLPAQPINIMASPVVPLALSITWELPPASLKTGNASGFRIEFSTQKNFQHQELAIDVGNASTQNNNVASSFLYLSPSFQTKMCIYVRIFSRNRAGLGPDGVNAGGCTTLIDYPPTISLSSIWILGGGCVRAEWSPVANELLMYRVDILAYNGSLINSQLAVNGSNNLAFPVPLDVALQFQVRSMLVNGAYSQYNPTVYFDFNGPALIYRVPFNFRIEPTTVESYPGTTSQFLVVPESSPTLDIVISISSSVTEVATVTDHLLFVPGSAAPQEVIVYHLRPGYSNITFLATGSLFSGLDVTVSVKTLLTTDV